MDKYPFDMKFLKGSKFYPVEVQYQEGCDTCDMFATHQTFDTEDTLLLACIPCLKKFKLPMEDDDTSIKDYEAGLIIVKEFE